MKLEEMPRIRLTQLPTPLEELTNFSKALAGPSILMKRDDLTSLCMGGNKVRKLEYIMADALQSGADVVITTGGVQTNHGRLTAAAARKLGLKPVLVLTGEEPCEYKANLLLDYLLGAELHFVAPDHGLEPAERAQALEKAVERKMRAVQAEYEAAGHKCYIIPLGGSMRVATAGYLNGMLETQGQLISMGRKVNHLLLATGSTSTTSALILANKVFNTGIKVVGISVWRTAEYCRKQIPDDLKKDAEFYEYDVRFDEQDFTIIDDYIGRGYGIPTNECLKAVKLLAETEGIIVDTTYTGKALAGLIDLTRKSYFKDDEAVLFLHTGGGPGIFTRSREEFETALSS